MFFLLSLLGLLAITSAPTSEKVNTTLNINLIVKETRKA